MAPPAPIPLMPFNVYGDGGSMWATPTAGTSVAVGNRESMNVQVRNWPASSYTRCSYNAEPMPCAMPP